MPAPPDAPGDAAARAYSAPAWLPHAHLQTFWTATLAPRATVNYERERWTTPDDDFIDVDLARPADAPTALLVLFHGLEGSSASQYARSVMAAARQAGWLGAVAHFRGCSGEMNRAPRAYHSGDSAEIDWILGRFAQRWAHLPRFAAGVSLGGNALLKWAGEQGEAATGTISACAAVSAPQDLHAGAIALSRGPCRLYTRNFLRTLKLKSLRKLEQFPRLFDRQRMLRARDFFAFDDAVTAPMHGFAGCIDYWQRASSRRYLSSIRMPCLVINARNDPFHPGRFLARPEDVSPQVRLEYPHQGGHVGFITGAPPGQTTWTGERLVRWFGQGH